MINIEFSTEGQRDFKNMKSDKDVRGGFNNSNIGLVEILEEENRINIQINKDWEFFTTENLERYLQWVYLPKD